MEADALVRRALAAHLADGVETEPNFSVRLGSDDTDRRGARELSILYRSGNTAIRSRSSKEIVEGLAAFLCGMAAPYDGMLVTSAVPVQHRGGVVLVPVELFAMLDRLDPLLRRAGLAFVNVPWTLLDPGSGEVVLHGDLVDLDTTVLADLDPRGTGPSGLSDAGRYAVRGWLFSGDTAGELPRSVGVGLALPTTNWRSLGSATSLQGLARVFATAQAVSIGRTAGRDTVDTVVRLLDPSPERSTDAM